MKNFYIFFVMLGFFLAVPSSYLFAQVGINVDNSAPDVSAGLDVKFSDKGVLLPRMTRIQRNAIATPAEGLMVYCTTCGTNGSLSIFTNGSWITVAPCTVALPVAGSPVMSQGQIVWNWQTVLGAAGYKWNTMADYETAIDMAAATTKTETGTGCGITYNRYIWAYSSCGESAMTTLTATIPSTVPATPVASTHVAAQASIVWNWNTEADVIGYKWNTTDDYASAIEIGTATTKSESGLTCATNYTRFVWAYNGCGYSTSLSLAQTTLACWICEINTLTISHLASAGVAPVDKMVTYGTVTNIPGELTKCWITSNLGSDHQATAVNDATEASAGWYWQFNRKQGYKHNGTTRTPNTTWIATINENLDWQPANDPCSLELGGGWRIPTNTEWTNADASWTNWNGPWNSGLKMHGAGYLIDNTGGSLGGRGSYGNYWSSNQCGNTCGASLNISSTLSTVGPSTKAFAFSLRCLRD